MTTIHFIVFSCSDDEQFSIFSGANSYFWLNDTPQYLEWDLPGVSFETLQSEILKLYSKPTNPGELVRSIDYIIVIKKKTEQKAPDDILALLQELSEEINAISDKKQEKYSNRSIPDWLQDLSDEINALENKYKDDQPTGLKLEDKTIIDLESGESANFNIDVPETHQVDENAILEEEIGAEDEEECLPPIINQNPVNEEPVHEGNNQPANKEPVHEGNNQPVHEEPVHEGNNQPVHEEPVHEGDYDSDKEKGYEADDEFSDSSDDESDDESDSDQTNHDQKSDSDQTNHDQKSDSDQTNHDQKSDSDQNDSQCDEHHLPLPNEGDECDKHHVVFDEYYLIKYVGEETVKLVAAYKIFKYGDEIIGSYIVGGINSVIARSEESVLRKYYLGIKTMPDMSSDSRQGIEYLFKNKRQQEDTKMSTIESVQREQSFSKIRVLGIVLGRNTSSFIVQNTRSFFKFRSMRFITRFMRQVWLNERMVLRAVNPIILLKPICLDIRSAFAQPLLTIINTITFRDFRSWLYFKIGILGTWLNAYLYDHDGEDFLERVENTDVFRRKTHGFQPFIEVLNIVFHKDTIAMMLRAFNFKNATLAVLQAILISCVTISFYRYSSRNRTFPPLANIIVLRKKASIETFSKYQNKYLDLRNRGYSYLTQNDGESHKLSNLAKAYNKQQAKHDYNNLLGGNREITQVIDSMIFNQFQIPKSQENSLQGSNELSLEGSTKSISDIVSQQIIQAIVNLLQPIYLNKAINEPCEENESLSSESPKLDYFSIISFQYWSYHLISVLQYFIRIWYQLVKEYLANISQLPIVSEFEIQINNLNNVDILKSQAYSQYNHMLFKEHINQHHRIDAVGITKTINQNLDRFMGHLDSIFNMQTQRYDLALVEKHTWEFHRLVNLLYIYFLNNLIYKEHMRLSNMPNCKRNIVFYISCQIHQEMINIRNKHFLQINSLPNISSVNKQNASLSQYNNIIPQFRKSYKPTINCLQSDFCRYSDSLNGVNFWKSMTILLKSNKLKHLLDNRSRITPRRKHYLKKKYNKLDRLPGNEIQYKDIQIESLKDNFPLTLESWNMFIKTSSSRLIHLYLRSYNEYMCLYERINRVIKSAIVKCKTLINKLIQFIQHTYNQIIVSQRFQFLFYRFQIVPQIFYWLSYALELFYEYWLKTREFMYLLIKVFLLALKYLAIQWRRMNASYRVKCSEMILHLQIQSSDKFSSTVFNTLNTHSGTNAWTTAFGIGSVVLSNWFTVGAGLFSVILWIRFERIRDLLLPNSHTELDLLVFLRYRRNREKFIGRKINDEEDDLLQDIYVKSLRNTFTGLRIKLSNTLGRKLLTSWFVDTGTGDVFYHARKFACQLLVSEPEIVKINLSSLDSSLSVTNGPYVTESPRVGLDYLNRVVRSTFSDPMKKIHFGIKLMTLLGIEKEAWLPTSKQYSELIIHPVTTTPLSRGILLVGPPDTGKHFIARSLASDNNFPLVYFSIEDLLTLFEFENEPIYSESAAYFFRENMIKINVMMDFYKLVSPCVVWMPKLESINNSYVSSRVRRVAMRMFSRYLLKDIKQTRMKHKNTLFIGSCEDTSYLDPGFIREGNFDRVINVRRPVHSRRPQIFARLIKLKGFRLDDELEWYPTFGNNSMGYSMRELAHFANRVCQDYILYDDKKNSFNLSDLKLLIIKEMRAITGGGKYDNILSRYDLQYKIGRVLVQMLFVKPQPTVSLFARMDVWMNDLYTLSRVFLEPSVESSTLNPFIVLRYILSYVAGFAAKNAWLILHPKQINPLSHIQAEGNEDILLASNLFAGLFKYFAHCELIYSKEFLPNFRHLYGTHTLEQVFLPVERPSLSEENKKEIGIEIVDPTMSLLPGYQPRYLNDPKVEVVPDLELCTGIDSTIKEYRIAMSRTIHFEVMQKIYEPFAPLSAEKYYGKLCINSLVEEKHRAELYLYYASLDTAKYTVAYNLDYEHYLMLLQQQIKEMKLKRAQLSILNPEHNPFVNDIVVLEGRSVWNPSAFEPRNVVFRNRGLYANEELMCVYYSHYKAQKGYSVYENPFLMHRKTLRKRIWSPDEYYERLAVEKIRQLQEEQGLEESSLMVYGETEPEEGEAARQRKGALKSKKGKFRAAKILGGKKKSKRLPLYKYKHLIYANSIFPRPRMEIIRRHNAPSKKKVDQSRFSGISILQDRFSQYRSFNKPTYGQEKLVYNCIFDCYTYLVKFFITHQELLINVTDALLGEIRLTEDEIILIIVQYCKSKKML